MCRMPARIHSFSALVTVFREKVGFLQKLSEDILDFSPAVLPYFLPTLNFSCHFRLGFPPELADGRISRDMGS